MGDQATDSVGAAAIGISYEIGQLQIVLAIPTRPRTVLSAITMVCVMTVQTDCPQMQVQRCTNDVACVCLGTSSQLSYHYSSLIRKDLPNNVQIPL